jgi:Fur family ferric uptake transcriptional regulator
MDQSSQEALIDQARSRGLRITTARRAVCAVLADTHGEHLTAAAIHQRILASGETSIDPSTVYRTLETLEHAGLITHTHMGHGALVYHVADEAPHQHLMCTRCGTSLALAESELAGFFAEITARTGFVPDPSHVALNGLCRDCAG